MYGLLGCKPTVNSAKVSRNFFVYKSALWLWMDFYHRSVQSLLIQSHVLCSLWFPKRVLWSHVHSVFPCGSVEQCTSDQVLCVLLTNDTLGFHHPCRLPRLPPQTRSLVPGNVVPSNGSNSQVDMPFFATEEGRYLASCKSPSDYTNTP